MKDFRELDVWKKGIQLTKQIYQVTEKYPKEELFGLTSQMRRAAVSIPSNIAEGFERKTTKDFIHFLYIAKGSKAELETQIQISVELRFLSQSEANELLCLCTDISKMLLKLINSLQKNNP